MKILSKILFLFFLLVIFSYASLHAFVNIKGKILITKKLEEIFQKKSSVGSLKTRFPFDLILKDVKVEGLFEIGRIEAGGGVIDILGGDLILTTLRVDGVKITIDNPKKQEDKNVQNISQDVTAVDGAVKTSVNLEKSKIDSKKKQKVVLILQELIIRKLLVTNSVIQINDYNAGPEPIKITIDNLAVNVYNIKFPVDRPETIDFDISGQIPWESIKERGSLDIKGWVDFYKKDLKVDLTIKDIDAIYLYPYYKSWFDLEKAKIQKAKLLFTSKITGLNNEISAPCHLELTEIQFKERQVNEQQERMEKIAHVVLDVFKSLNQGKIVLDFTLRTKMDSPELGLGNLKAAFDDKLEIVKAKKRQESLPNNLVNVPVKFVEGMYRGVTDLSKAFFSIIETVVGSKKRI